MFFVRKPSAEAVRSLLEAQARLDPSYPEVGASFGPCPPGYRANGTRVRLGAGDEVFRAARAALARWAQFDLGWAGVVPADAAPAIGGTVAVVARCVGLWWVNPCRVVAVVDEKDRFGYACGTLPGHAAAGEERFVVVRDRADGGVWYDLASFSRPRHPLVRLGAAYLRVVQRRFGRDSAAALRRAVAADTGETIPAR
ncbi:MAG: DUF1990 domain-containing protein [Planctomycetes bacterium]|nr:DUF1990 domain-containing protein [Planctomycetota bacterium]